MQNTKNDHTANNGSNDQKQGQENNSQDPNPQTNPQEIPDREPDSHEEPIKGGEKQIPEIDRDNVHTYEPAVAAGDFGTTGTDTQNTGTAVF